MGRADFPDSAHICIIQEFLGMSIRPAQNKLVLQVASDQTLFKIDFKLGVDLPPVLLVSGPFFRDIHSCQISLEVYTNFGMLPNFLFVYYFISRSRILWLWSAPFLWSFHSSFSRSISKLYAHIASLYSMTLL